MAGKMGRKTIHLLLRKKAAIIVNGSKLTTEAGREVRYCLGEHDARVFYTAPQNLKGGGLGWSNYRFDQVAWKELDTCLEKKPNMYGIWFAKQAADVCATRYNMARLQDLIDNKCPNCGQVERAIHLNMCPSDSRMTLLLEGVTDP